MDRLTDSDPEISVDMSAIFPSDMLELGMNPDEMLKRAGEVIASWKPERS